MSQPRLEQIAIRDPSFALELIDSLKLATDGLPSGILDDLCRSDSAARKDSLAARVFSDQTKGKLRNELSILTFCLKFISAYEKIPVVGVITPGEVQLTTKAGPGGTLCVTGVKISHHAVNGLRSMYQTPSWSEAMRWRIQLGYLLRFMLSGQPDFTRTVRRRSWRDDTQTYRASESSWYQRLYGFYNGHDAFGNDWLPISEWIEHLVLALLRWPGCGMLDASFGGFGEISSAKAKIKQRLGDLKKLQGTHTSALLIPVVVPYLRSGNPTSKLRACIVQTVIPTGEELEPGADLTLTNEPIRKNHRRHLSAALSAIRSALMLRNTHARQPEGLDWLLLPELSVHPSDVRRHLIPFARANNCIILAGITYEELWPGGPLINSAFWVIPRRTAQGALHTLVLRQGKCHLAPAENKLPRLEGFRPCQWILHCEWFAEAKTKPIRLSAAVCYDATDLRLAADLRGNSDVFAIPALNKDVGTFDNMATALHYHMFQMVIIANNGLYGGSNVYAPYDKPYHRQILHLHGQPQAAIAFVEIDTSSLANRLDRSHAVNPGNDTDPKVTRDDSPRWKEPPAGI